MKNLSFKTSIAVVLLFFYVQALSAQPVRPAKQQVDHTEFSLQKTINLDNESEEMEIFIPISDTKVSLSMKIASEVWSGELTIEVYDPAGEKLGDYSVGNESTVKVNKGKQEPSRNEAVRGQIIKTVDFPTAGKWKFLIIPKNARATLNINTNQVSIKK